MPLLKLLPPQVCILSTPMASDTITPQVEPAKGAILVSRRLLQAILETEVGMILSPQLRGTPEHERESPTRQRYIHT